MDFRIKVGTERIKIKLYTGCKCHRNEDDQNDIYWPHIQRWTRTPSLLSLNVGEHIDLPHPNTCTKVPSHFEYYIDGCLIGEAPRILPIGRHSLEIMCVPLSYVYKDFICELEVVVGRSRYAAEKKIKNSV